MINKECNGANPVRILFALEFLDIDVKAILIVVFLFNTTFICLHHFEDHF